jgi:hypothetical protein
MPTFSRKKIINIDVRKERENNIKVEKIDEKKLYLYQQQYK